MTLQSETVLIQRIYTHFKKAPATHKLGVLYVVDSVTRAWVEQARKTGQALSPGAPDGTFVAGINRVTELLPSFLNDIINTASEDHKVSFCDTLDVLSTVACPLMGEMSDVLMHWDEPRVALFPVFLRNHKLTYSSVYQARILKLIDIWERGNTFPSAMLASFRPKVSAPALSGKTLQSAAHSFERGKYVVIQLLIFPFVCSASIDNP